MWFWHRCVEMRIPSWIKRSVAGRRLDESWYPKRLGYWLWFDLQGVVCYTVPVHELCVLLPAVSIIIDIA